MELVTLIKNTSNYDQVLRTLAQTSHYDVMLECEGGVLLCDPTDISESVIYVYKDKLVIEIELFSESVHILKMGLNEFLDDVVLKNSFPITVLDYSNVD